MYALELTVAKYQPSNRYSSTCIQAFPVALRGLFYIIVYYTFEHIGLPFYYIYYTFEHVCMPFIFIVHTVHIIINSEWCHSTSVA